MQKVTMVKSGRKSETLRLVEMGMLVDIILQQEYMNEVNEVRRLYPVLNLHREEDGSLSGAANFTDKIPRVCFASQLENRNHQRLRKSYTGLVLLEVNNLTSYEEADAIRKGCSQMPHTLLAFVGLSGRSVKIVCRGESLEGTAGKVANTSAKADGDASHLPTDNDDIRRFHVNLYEKARMAYNAQLGVTIEKLDPGLERTCYVGADKGVVWNPDALPFYVDLSGVEQAVSLRSTTNIEPRETAPGLVSRHTFGSILEHNLSKAYDDLTDIDRDDELLPQLLAERLADECCATGIPEGIALSLTEHRWPFRENMELTRRVFDNAYRKVNEKRYRGRKPANTLLKNVPAETLMTMKIDIFLRENYELRKNVMRGVAEFRKRTGLGFDFQDLTEEARNSMTLRALERGIKCWDKDIRRYVCSDDIELYDPIGDFLEHLPQWDGRDRVEPLACRVKTAYADWPHLFHIWMRSMVAMWQGKGQLTGNALVPLLIGRQGCGKSSFCRILLPRDQRDYYNDRINFKNEQDLNLGLTSFALINLDEFDRVTQRQQIVLKYLVSTADLKYRPPYGKAYRQHRRYASFIGTTNEQAPLTDPSGSRRFVCVEVEGNIDFQTPVEYAQIYAQLKQEIHDGERYWLTKDEEAALMLHNRQYQRLSGLSEMLFSLYRKPEDGEEGQWLSLKTISARLKDAFSGIKEEPGTLEKLGNLLRRPEYQFQSRRMAWGMEYLVQNVK